MQASRLAPLLRALFVVIGTLPWWIPLARARFPLGAVGVELDRVFIPMCHRLPERTLVLAGIAMPVCSRCAGVFAGLAVGAVIARPHLRMTVWRPTLVALGLAMVIDVVTQDLGLHPVWHPVRLATGFAFGYAMVTSFVTHVARAT